MIIVCVHQSQTTAQRDMDVVKNVCKALNEKLLCSLGFCACCVVVVAVLCLHLTHVTVERLMTLLTELAPCG